MKFIKAIQQFESASPASMFEKDTDRRRVTEQPIVLHRADEIIFKDQADEQKSTQPEVIAFSMDWLGKAHAFSKLQTSLLKSIEEVSSSTGMANR